jgi:hypothetical protein
MKPAKTIAYGAALGLAVGSAIAGEGSFGMNDSWSTSEPMAQEETFILPEPVDVATAEYGVDENRDGVTDSYLILEGSDTLATSEGFSSEGSDTLATSEGLSSEESALALSEDLSSEGPDTLAMSEDFSSEESDTLAMSEGFGSEPTVGG